MENLDHVGFYIPNENAFSFFIAIYKHACQVSYAMGRKLMKLAIVPLSSRLTILIICEFAGLLSVECYLWVSLEEL